MAATAPEIVGAQCVVPNPLLDRGGGRFIPCAHERYREHYCLPRRAISMDLRPVDREAPYEPSARIDRSFCERHRRGLFDVALSDRSHHMVARSEELASQSYRKLGGRNFRASIGTCTARLDSGVSSLFCYGESLGSIFLSHDGLTPCSSWTPLAGLLTRACFGSRSCILDGSAGLPKPSGRL
jgi:hypothetical protein